MFCCEESTHCLAEGGGTLCRAPRPGTVTVTGPSISPPHENVRLSAAATTEGEVREFVWLWGDGESDTDSFVDSNTSESDHSYWSSGRYTVNVRARDSFGFETQASYAISICSEAGSQCSTYVDCCPGLTCQPQSDGPDRCG